MGHGPRQVVSPHVGGRFVARGRMRERAIKSDLRQFLARGRLRPQRHDPALRVDGRRILPRMEAGLQLASPVPAFGHGQVGLARVEHFRRVLAEALVVERAEARRGSAQVADERALGLGDVDESGEAHLAGGCEADLGLLLDRGQGLAGRQQVGDEEGMAHGGPERVARLLGGIQRDTKLVETGRDMLLPCGLARIGDAHDRLVAPHPRTLDELPRQSIEAHPRHHVVEEPADPDARVGVDQAGGVGAAFFQRQLQCRADHQRPEVLAHGQRARGQLREHADGRQ